MYAFLKFLHLAAAIVWLGGMAFVLAALRPTIASLLPPAQRLPLLAQALSRFFMLVWGCIALLLLTGSHWLLSTGMRAAPLGWHLMLGLGLLMSLIFAHIFFAPFRRLKVAVQAADWPEGGRRAGQIATLVRLNFGLGWLAVAAVLFVR